MAYLTTDIPQPLPNEFASAVERLAARDADDVISFLRSLKSADPEGQAESPKPKLSETTLLALGLAHRHLRWERAGINAHLERQLPSAKDLLIYVRENPVESAFRPVLDRWAVLGLEVYQDTFVWADCEHEVAARLEFDEDSTSESFLEAVADFLIAVGNETAVQQSSKI